MMNGSIQGSPSEIPMMVCIKYRAKFKQSCNATEKREKEEDNRVNTVLNGALKKIDEALDLASLIKLHQTTGKGALRDAKMMLVKELNWDVKSAGGIHETPKRELFEELLWRPQRIRVDNIKSAIRYCDKLMLEVAGLPENVRNIKIET
jgi:hypothetical protein